ncbi:MAG: ComEC/Rec2 family competence protein, partial [Clostridia bacterium]
ISTTIYRYSSVESAPILKALILGDKSSMSPIDKDAFRRAGIIHVLAVSGLHIGFVVAIFAFILKKLHLNRWLRTVILIGAIVMYGYICGFPPSVMRAIIMTVVTLLYSALHRRTDLLSSLSISVIVILCARPLFLFDAGFLMSVGAIYGIVTFTSQATRRVLFQKPRMVIDYLYKALCTSVGASLGTVGFVAHYYKEVSLIGVFFNIIAIPLVTVAFVVTAIGLLPIPAIGYIIFISDKIIWLVTTISHLLAQIPFATVVVGGFGVAIALLGIWLFVYGGFVNITHKKVTLIFLAIVFAVTTSLYALPQNASDEIVGFGSSYGGKVVVVTSKESDKAYLIGEFNDVNAIQDVCDFIVNKKINSLDICVTDFESVDTDILATYYKLLKVKTIYVMDNTVNEQCSVLA